MARNRTARRPLADNVVALVVGSLLALAVAYIHVKDQEGFPGAKDPGYLQALYYVLEAAAVVTVALLVSFRTRALGWLLAVGVSIGPIIGYVLTRGPGLPDATDDRGNWGETLGVVSLVVEGLLLLLSLAALASTRRREALTTDVYDSREAAYDREARSQIRR